MNNKQFMHRVLNKFLVAFEKDLEQIKSEVSACEFVAAAKTAHKMKGSAGNLSAIDLTNCMAEFENKAKTNEVNALNSVLEEIDSHWETVKSKIVETCGGSPTIS